MEKIYEENNNEKKPKKISFSVVLSFVVALFAIASLVAVGFNQISYAAPDGSQTPKTVLADDIGMFGGTGSNQIYVPTLLMDSKQIYCVQFDEEVYGGPNYEVREDINSDVKEGLIYLLNADVTISTTTTCTPSVGSCPDGDDAEKVIKGYWRTYIKQLAIWEYLKEKNVSGNSTFDLSMIHDINSITVQDREHNSFSFNLGGVNIEDYVTNLVTIAKNPQHQSRKTLTAAFNSTSVSKLDGADIYQSDKATVTAKNGNLKSYYVELSGELANDAYVVNANGEKKGENDAFGPGEVFYIRVPGGKLSEETVKSVNVTIVGLFESYYDGAAFVATGSQDVMSLGPEEYRVTPPAISVNFKKVGDTKMTTAQTIYFIGLIVLLCGVGIIYANAKPVEEK